MFRFVLFSATFLLVNTTDAIEDGAISNLHNDLLAEIRNESSSQIRNLQDSVEKILVEFSMLTTKLNETDELEERVEVLADTVLLLQDKLNDVRVDIDDLETQDSLIDVRMLSVEADVLRNEDEIEDLDTRMNTLEVTVAAHTTDIINLVESDVSIEQRLLDLEQAFNAPWAACESSPCDNGATCVDVNVDTFICVCRDGFFGVSCSESYSDISFLASSKYQNVTPESGTIIFDLPFFNQGGYYDNSTAIFKAPLDGVYEFNIQIYAIIGDPDWSFSLRVDGARITYSRHTTIGSESDAERNSTVRWPLSMGQEVWVGRDGIASCYGSDVNSLMYSWFSGHLVSAD